MSDQVNERRKAQNRAAQKKYRTRQKLRIELARAILYDKPNQHSESGNDRPDWISAVGDFDEGYQNIAAGRHNNTNNTAPQWSPAPADSIESLAITHLLNTDNGRHPRLLRDGDALAAALESYGIPFDLDASSNHNVDPAKSLEDDPCLDPSLTQIDWMRGNDEGPSGGALPSSGTSAFSSSEVDRYIRSPESHRISSLSSSSSSSSTASSSSSSSSSLSASCSSSLPSSISSPRPSTASSLSASTAALTMCTLPTVVDGSFNNPVALSPLKTYCSAPHTRKPSDTAPTSTSTTMTNNNNNNDDDDDEDDSPHDLTSSPLYTAISLGNMDMARLLVRSGAKVDLPDPHTGDTLLHHCVRRGDVATSRALLDLGASVLQTTAAGRTSLHLAVGAGHEAMVTMLLDWCADGKEPGAATGPATTGTGIPTTSPPPPPPSSSLSSAAQPTSRRQSSLVSSESPGRLRANGSLLARFINARDAHNTTALHLSVKLQRIDVLKVLLKYGANVNPDPTQTR